MAGRYELNVDDLVKITWGELEGHIDWEGNESRKNEIDKIIRDRASLEVRHFKALADLQTPEEPDLKLAASAIGLTPKDIEYLKQSIEIDTFRMEIQDGVEARYLLGEKEFLDRTPLTTINGITTASVWQIGSLVIEIVLFVLGVLGIRVSLKEAQLKRMIEGIKPVLQQPAFRQIIQKFVESWQGGSAYQKAKAVFNVLREIKAFGIFWKLVRAALDNMSWFEKAKALAEVALMIVAAFATAGVALIVKIAQAVGSAYKIIKKVANLLTLEDNAKKILG